MAWSVCRVSIVAAMCALTACEPTTDLSGGPVDAAGLGDRSSASPGAGPGFASELPFAIDAVFVASGYMGDGTLPGAVRMTDVAQPELECAGVRGQPSTVPDCHRIAWLPQPKQTVGWAGVVWQWPSNNWGAERGASIAAGARRVSFRARGVAGGEVVQFSAGGIGSGPDAPYRDGWKVAQAI